MAKLEQHRLQAAPRAAQAKRRGINQAMKMNQKDAAVSRQSGGGFGEEGEQEQPPYDEYAPVEGRQRIILDYSPTFACEAGLLLQWKGRKRAQSGRVQNCHNTGDFKPTNALAIDEPFMLYHATMQIQQVRPLKAEAITSFFASESIHNANAATLFAEKRKNQQACLILEGRLDSDAKERMEGLHVRKEEQRSPLLLQEPSKPCTMAADPKLPSKDHQCDSLLPAAAGDNRNGTPSNESKNGPIWPKFVSALSRKEKREDFLLINGTRLPNRPRHRSHGVKRALLHCIPGSSLANISESRYVVKERKHCKKNLNGNSDC